MSTNQSIKDVYAPSVASYKINGGILQSAPADLDRLEDTLREANDQLNVLEVPSVPQPGQPHRATLEVNFAGIRTPIDRVAAGYEFFFNLESACVIAPGANTSPGGNTQIPGGPHTEVDIMVFARYDNATQDEIQLWSTDDQKEVSTGRNTFGQTRATWFVPNWASPVKIDPSKIRIEAVARPGTPAFNLSVDLVQVVPFAYDRPQLERATCIPTFTSSNSPTSPAGVSGALFGPSGNGLRLTWTNRLLLDEDTAPVPATQNARQRWYARVYRSTGSPTHPFADITCSTIQALDANDVNGRSLRIWYAPGAASGPQNPIKRPLPSGLYQFSMAELPSAVRTECGTLVYGHLRGQLSSTGDYIAQPLVMPESVWVTVSNQAAPSFDPCEHLLPFPSSGCYADVDDGSSVGIRDGGVGVEDLLYYLVLYEQGVLCADTDDGTSTGTRDGGIGIEDMLYYLIRFDSGC
jgi:hypothetical protein